MATAGLQLLSAKIRLRRGYGDRFFPGSRGDRFNGPHPTEVAILVECPCCPTASPDFHSPVIAVGRNCEHKRDCCRNHHSEQHSNQKYASHVSQKVNQRACYRYRASGRFCRPTQELFLPPSFAQALFPHFTYALIEARRSADCLFGRD
jgi:hypothetical protein